MNSENIIFAKMDNTDLPEILRISEEIILNTYVSFLGEKTVNEYITSRQFENEIVPNMNDCIVMKTGEVIIGFSILLENKLHLIMIDSKYQNKKYGTKLLSHVEGVLFSGYSAIVLQSFTGILIANTFYEKNGWRKVIEINLNGISLYKYDKIRHSN
jgi:GNAT superfamily N-acetyltransferase